MSGNGSGETGLTVPEMPPAGVLTGAELLYLVQNKQDVRSTVANLSTFLPQLYLPLTGGAGFPVTGEAFFTAAGTGISVTNGLTAGSALFGTGTPTGALYNFQAALNYDPSAGPAFTRQNMFNTTLTYATNTTNVFEGVTAFTTVNGPGQANGEINGFHSFFQVNPGATMHSAEGYETSMFNQAVVGTWFGLLSQQHNGTTGTATQIWGSSFSLQNDNTTAGAVGVYAAINFEPMSGGGSLPTFYNLIRGNDPLGAISTKGGVSIGGLSNPGPGVLSIQGTDNSSGTFPIVVKNQATDVLFFLDNAGTTHFVSGTGTSLTLQGPDTSGATAVFSAKNSATSNLMVIADNGVTSFFGGTSIGPASLGSMLTLQGPDNSAATTMISAKNLAGTSIMNVNDAGTSFGALVTFGVTAGLKFASSFTGAGTQTFTNSPATGLTSAQWIQVSITGQTGIWYIPCVQ